MIRVDFYILKTTSLHILPFVCKLVEKAYAIKQRVYIHADSVSQARQLDDLLWTFREGDFIPHQMLGDKLESLCPIYIGSDNNVLNEGEILINLTAIVPEFYASFTRIIEVVPGVEPQRSESRKKYAYYRDQACQLQTHQL
ncbi:DNA polymerase III subunit chi [soil metagenome]